MCGKCLTFQMRAVILGVMSKWKLKAQQLSVVDLATFGHLICGLYPPEIKKLSPYTLRSVKYLPYDYLHFYINTIPSCGITESLASFREKVIDITC